MKMILELPDFTEHIVITGTSYSDADHRRAFSAAFRAEADTLIGFSEKKTKYKSKVDQSEQVRRKMSPYQYKTDPLARLGEWKLLNDEPPADKPLIVTMMPKDRTLFDRVVREARYINGAWTIPEEWRVVSWRYMPDAFEGGYQLDDDGAELLVEAIIYQIYDDYVGSARKIAKLRKRLADYMEKKKKNVYYRDKANQVRDEIRIEKSKMLDCENAILDGWASLIGERHPEEALNKMREAAKEYLEEE